jgi:hypothetical protein
LDRRERREKRRRKKRNTSMQEHSSQKPTDVDVAGAPADGVRRLLVVHAQAVTIDDEVLAVVRHVALWYK